jgi:hypothetical protein
MRWSLAVAISAPTAPAAAAREPICMLTVFGAEGRATSADVYEAESTTGRSRFDELSRYGVGASRATERCDRCPHTLRRCHHHPTTPHRPS